MFLDAGYVQYSRRQEVGNAQNHNMILVNEQGPPIGQPLTPGSADAFFINNFSLPPSSSYCRAKHRTMMHQSNVRFL